MLDFVKIAHSPGRKGSTDVFPIFVVNVNTQDLMIRGGDFYAVWNEEAGMWSTEEQTVIVLVDRLIDDYIYEHRAALADREVHAQYMWNSSTGAIDKWHKFCQKQMRDTFHPLDEKVIFSNTPVKKRDYVSMRLPYSIEPGNIDAYDTIMSTLYDPEERQKLEWSIGAIISGDSKKIQKFIVLYGDSGAGKSTFLNIVQDLFTVDADKEKKYWQAFEAKELGRSSNDFSLDAFQTNPLIAINHDGELSKIEDNTKLNSLVSHETMMVNPKYAKKHPQKFKSFLYIGTNRPVKITEAKSGIIRRLIDVRPSGRLIKPESKYLKLCNDISFELGAIADHCLRVYKEMGPHFYGNYAPREMLSLTNDFYDFVSAHYDVFRKADETTLKAAWAMYKEYCDYAKVAYPYSLMKFKGELKNYFREHHESYRRDGATFSNFYIGFRWDKFEFEEKPKEVIEDLDGNGSGVNGVDVAVVESGDDISYDWIKLKRQHSLLDDFFAENGFKAQYDTGEDPPIKAWRKVTSTINDIQTGKLHWVNVFEKLVVLDFDCKDENGNKSLELSLKAAAKWPKTYAEVSKSGNAIHLHYIYNGDVKDLADHIDEQIEVKVYTGDQALRRCVTLCNDIPITTISSGLPKKAVVKGVSSTVDLDKLRNEKAMRATIMKCLRKESVWSHTSENVDLICKIINDNYENGTSYDISDLEPLILDFASNSTNQATKCISKVVGLPFRSKDKAETIENDIFGGGCVDQEWVGSRTAKMYKDDAPIVIFDCEVFPNLLLVCWKYLGEGKPIQRMFNPTPIEIEALMQNRLIGFNNLNYDNEIILMAWKGASNAQIYDKSQAIIGGVKYAVSADSKNVSYTDVFDYCAKKQSLKKWEIELADKYPEKKIKHHELGLDWSKPVDPKMWDLVAEYCEDDVLATELVYLETQPDFKGRQILCELANLLVGPGSTVNHSTNTLTTKLIVGDDKEPQQWFVYPNLSERFPGYEHNPMGIERERYISKDVIIKGKSFYRGYDPGEGGFALGVPGMRGRVVTFDVASMHPSSIIAENGFGKYTKNFKSLLDIRLAIKHKDYDTVKSMYGGALAKYLTTKEDAKALSYALKIAINSVYGLTAAGFKNRLRDPRNVDNWVAKRGALFMITLMQEVEKLGYTWCHIKTDSIKIVNPDEKISQFIIDFGKKYGYTFEVEAEYDRFCLVNDAVYISRYAKSELNDPKDWGKWSATGTEFKIPYVFKKLFSHEKIGLSDLCITKSSKTALYLDMNEDQEKLKAAVESGKLVGDEINPVFITQEKNKKTKEMVDIYHLMHFVGKTGLFAPIKAGRGGGVLLVRTDDKYSAVQNTKKKGKLAEGEEPVWRFLEAETIRENPDLENDISYEYWDIMAQAAKEHIQKYGDYDLFISDAENVLDFGAFMNLPEGVGNGAGSDANWSGADGAETEYEFKVPDVPVAGIGIRAA